MSQTPPSDSATALQAVILDVDGTLVDSVGQHAEAWSRALREHGFEITPERVRPLIGMSGSRLLPELDIDPETPAAKAAEGRRQKLFLEEYLPTVEAFPGTKALLRRMRDAGLRLVIASSASGEELDPLLERAGATELIEARTSADADVDSKPAPDLVQKALEQLGVAPERAVMIGDTPWDVKAAAGAGVRAIALRCSGWNDDDLDEAVAIYDDPADLLERFDRSPLAAHADGD